MKGTGKQQIYSWMNKPSAFRPPPAPRASVQPMVHPKARDVSAGVQALSDPGVGRTHGTTFGNFHLHFALKCCPWLQDRLCLP